MNTSEKPTSFDREDLLRCAEGKLFADGNPRLPHGNMLMLDRITSIRPEGGRYGKGELHAELDIRPDLWFFECHFRGDPVMPGCLGVDALWQLGGFFLGWSGEKGKGRALGSGKIRFSGQVLPSAKLVSYSLDIKRVISRKLSMVLFDGRMSVDGRQIYTADDMKVGLFQSTDDF